MALQIEERDVEGITVLSVAGRLVAGPDATSLRERILKLIEQNKRNIILDFKHVDFIDSTGLGSLVMARSALVQTGGAVKLLHLSRRQVQLLVLTKLTTLFEMFDDEQEAINSFFPDRKVRHFDILEFVKSQENPEVESD
jgi:anti-sigma B factor antagonist